MRARDQYKEEVTQARRKRIITTLVFLFLFIFLVGGLGYIVFLSSFFSIQEVDIQGNHTITSATLQSSVSYMLHKNIFLARLDTASLENKFRMIESVSLEKEYPNKVTVHVTEFPPFAQVQTQIITYIVARNGFIIGSTTHSSSENLPLVISNVTDTKKIPLSQLMEYVSSLESDKHGFIVDFLYMYPYDITVQYLDHHQVLLSLTKSLSDQVHMIQAIATNLGFGKCQDLDVRFDRAYCSTPS